MIFASVMCSAHYLLSTKASVNLINTSILPSSWSHLTRRDNMSEILTATKYPPPFDGLIVVHIWLRELSTRVWFHVVPRLAVDIVFGFVFNNSFVCKILPQNAK